MAPKVNIRSSGKTALLPAFIGAIICLFFIRSGLATLVFLLPLGFIGYGWGPRTLWSGLLFAFLGNVFLTLSLGFSAGIPGTDMVWDILYFSVTAAAFAWIILPLDTENIFLSRIAGIPGPYRLAIGALLCTFIFIGLFLKTLGNESFYESIRGQIEMIASLYWSGNSAETQKTLLESLDIDRIIEVVRDMIIRGGALFSSLVILFVNRQLSIFLIRLFGGPRRKNVFMDFHVNHRIIWFLSFSVLLLLASNAFSWTVFSILLWNIVVLCVMMYLAQGFGILAFFMRKPGFPPFLRFLLPVIFIFLLFSPVINAVMLGIIIILGIAENWVAFRIRTINGPPSTPGV